MIAKNCSGLQMITGLDIENLSFLRKHTNINWTKANYTTIRLSRILWKAGFRQPLLWKRFALMFFFIHLNVHSKYYW